MVPAESNDIELPKRITRQCCSGKTCTTDLTLLEMEPVSAAGEPKLPVLYMYVRASNGDEFSGVRWMTRSAMTQWLHESQ